MLLKLEPKNIMSPKLPSLLTSLLKIEENIKIPHFKNSDIEYYLYEKYQSNAGNWKRKLYYTVKPFMPRFLQLALRKKYVKIQSKNTFPAWPIEPILVDIIDDFLKAVIEHNGKNHIHRIAPWPQKKKFAFVITHDVELDTGLQHAPRIAEIEKEFGFISSWNIVPERYPIDWKIIDRLRDFGCEIGVHGFSHDGKLFQSKKIFMKRALKINDYAKQWGAVGFRSESTLRNIEWMPALNMEYDSSFPDTDPYEPQPGGCCSIWPYFIQQLIELPLTLPQDHTLFEILNQTDISLWEQKVNWIEEHGGLALINVHPDYMNTPERLKLYESFLVFMSQKKHMWQAPARETARWWRNRNDCSLINRDDRLNITGPSSNKMSIIKTKIYNNIIENQLI